MEKLSLDNLRDVSQKLSSLLHQTPVIRCASLEQGSNLKVYFKCENFQKTGSFKARGALNAVLQSKQQNPDLVGVITHSSGNHGQALAWAAAVQQVKCIVVVPKNASSVKCDAIREYGANLVLCEPNPQAREETCARLAKELNYQIIPPYDHYDVIAGQASLGIELCDQLADIDAILVPVGGGGLISGVSQAVKLIRPSTRVFAVEVMGKQLETSLRAGERLWTEPIKFIDTVADGIKLSQPGHLTFPIMCENIDKNVFTVCDVDMINAMKRFWQRTKMIIEVNSAAAVAAALSSKMQQMKEIKSVAVIVSGGNVDLDHIPWIA